LVGWLLLAALLALVGVWLGREPGQVQVRWLGQQIDTSMAFVILALGVLVVLLWLLDGVLRRFPRSWRRRRTENLRNTYRRGWTCLAEGRAMLAKRLLLKASTLPEQRPLALFGAALAAQNCGEAALADELLGSLAKSPVAAAARAAYARQQLQAGHAQAAEVALTDLAVPAERLTWIDALNAQGRAAEVLARWPEVLALKLPDRDRLQQRQQQLLEAALLAANSREDLVAIWETLDRSSRELAQSVRLFATAAVRLDAGELALDPVHNVLAAQPDTALHALYGRLPHPDLRAALKRVEGWRANQAPSAALDLALAQLCRQLALWGKAHEVLGEALTRESTPALWEELGRWAAAQADYKLAAQALQNALNSARREAVEALELTVRGTIAASVNNPALNIASPAPANEERGVYGFPLPPGG
jgi:HemY protein